MVMVNVGGKEFYLNHQLKENLDFAYPKVMSGKYKFIAIVDGRSGYGKTTLVSQHAYYLSRGRLGLNDFCFNKKQTLERLDRSQPGDNIIIDEAFGVANKRTSRGIENMDFLSDLQKMRIKKTFLWIILPCIYDLDKNLILAFCDLFLHVYGKPFGEKGNFATYDIEGIKKLYLYCRQTLDYKKSVATPNFYGSFTSFFPFNEEEYDKRKRESKAFEEDNKPHKYLLQRNKALRACYEAGMSVKDISKIVGLDDSQTYLIIKQNEPIITKPSLEIEQKPLILLKRN